MADSYWATQSAVTNPGAAASKIDLLEPDIPGLRQVASQLVLHYRGRASEVPKGREPEIHTRLAGAMFDIVLSRGEPELTRDRGPADRVVGCCRDYTVVFLSILRQKGIPARSRVGFGSYFAAGWWIDHVVAEVWDGRRWRLVDPQMVDDRAGFDWCDLKPEQFLTGPQAWKTVREGKADPEKFVVDPRLQLKDTRGWPYLAHNVILDLTGMAKKEMLLWDSWGMITDIGEGPVAEADAAVLDEITKALLDPDVNPDVVQELASRNGLAIPSKVHQLDPYGGPPKEVDVSIVHQQS